MYLGINDPTELYLHSREMLRSIILNLSFWIYIFGFGLADEIVSIDNVSDVNFPPCIRIKGDISGQDIDTHGIIEQKFVFNRRNDNPDIPRYVSSDGEYVFKFNKEYDNDFQWFLIPRAANLVNAYLKTPAPYVGEVLSKNPFMIADGAWKIYTDHIWQSVTNSMKVENCEPSQQQDSGTEESKNSNQTQVSNQVTQPVLQPSLQPIIQGSNENPEGVIDSNQGSESTISPPTISQPNSHASTVAMTQGSIPECIKMKTEFRIFKDNDYIKIKNEFILKVQSKLIKSLF